MSRIYLDHAATTPMVPEAVEAMTRELTRVGNASSLHASGRSARRVVEESREAIAAQVGASSAELIFTSGGTESDNLAVKGAFWSGVEVGRRQVVTSTVEHHAEKKLFEWHRMIMAGSRGVQSGQWRTHAEPMQVVSGPVGKEKVHFEAPPSSRVPAEMKQFIAWFNETGPGGRKEIKKPVVRSAIAHLYFESIHPFEDGNGRIGRAISEKAISQGLGRPALLSLSRAIEAKKKTILCGAAGGPAIERDHALGKLVCEYSARGSDPDGRANRFHLEKDPPL